MYKQKYVIYIFQNQITENNSQSTFRMYSYYHQCCWFIFLLWTCHLMHQFWIRLVCWI